MSGLSDSELADISREIEGRDSASGDPSQSHFLQSLYLDRVYEKRQKAAEGLLEACLEYIGRPDVQRQHPCLMEASDGSVLTASKYVIWFMASLSADGIERNVSFALGECERCFAGLVYGAEPLHQ